MTQLQTIKQFILENFLFSDDGNALSEDASLVTAGIIDSTGVAELVTYLEEQFHIEVRADEMLPANFETLRSVDAFVTRKLAA